MVDRVELETILCRMQISKKQLAERLDISLQGLYNKLNNNTEFKASEIKKDVYFFKIESTPSKVNFFTL